MTRLSGTPSSKPPAPSCPGSDIPPTARSATDDPPLIDNAALQNVIFMHALRIPDPATVCPENDLNPPSARIAFEVTLLRGRVDDLETRIAALEGNTDG